MIHDMFLLLFLLLVCSDHITEFRSSLRILKERAFDYAKHFELTRLEDELSIICRKTFLQLFLMGYVKTPATLASSLSLLATYEGLSSRDLVVMDSSESVYRKSTIDGDDLARDI